MPRWMMLSPFAMRPYLAADESGGAGGGSGDSESGNGSSDDANADGETGGTDEVKPFATFKDEKSFTARIKREGNAQMLAKAKELGFDSVADMEAAIKAAKAKADEEKTELERAKEAAAKADADSKAVLARANDRLIRAEVKSVAADLSIVDADAAYALMSRDDITVAEDGTVSGVKDALEALVKAKPYLKKADGTPAKSGGEFKGDGGSKSADMNALIRRAAGRS